MARKQGTSGFSPDDMSRGAPLFTIIKYTKQAYERIKKMLTIKLSILVNANKEKVFKLLKDIEFFPKFIKNIESVKIIKRTSNNEILSEWKVDIDGAPAEWKQQDVFDDENFKIEFRMLEGDYDKYIGRWEILDASRGSKINLTTEFDWGIPNLEKFVGYILARKAKKNLKGMLMAVKKELEKGNLNRL